MDPRELEEKLERDNLTLKEHISKLQNTIKQIKSEIVGNNNSYSNETSTPLVEKREIRNKNKKELEEKDNNHLKFSFNNNCTAHSSGNNNSHNASKFYKYSEDEEEASVNYSEKKKIIRGELTNEKNEKSDKFLKNAKLEAKFEIPPNKNVYQNNLDKLRKEKDIIQQMETVKKKANLKKKFDDDDLDESEVDKFHQNYNSFKKGDINKRIKKSDSEEEEPKFSQNLPVFNNSMYFM